MTISLLAGIEVDSAEPSFAMWDLSGRARSSPPTCTAAVRSGTGRAAWSGCGPATLPRSPSVRGRVRRVPRRLRLARSERVGPHREGVGDPPRGRPRRPSTACGCRAMSTRHAPGTTPRSPSGPRWKPGARRGWPVTARRSATFDAALRSATVFLGWSGALQDRLYQGRERDPDVLPSARPADGRSGRPRPAEQVFMLLASELDAFRHEPERFSQVLREREATYLSLYDVEPVFIINGRVPPLSTWPKGATKRGGRGRPATCCPDQRDRGVGAGPGEGACWTPPIHSPSSRATCSWLPTRILPGLPCSFPPRPWSSRSGRWAATR